MIGHRRFILAFALCLFAWSPSADAQQPRKVPLVAVLSDESQSLGAKTLEPPFAQGLRDLGWVEGQNLTLERRYAAGNNELLLRFARQLVHLQPDVIFAIGTPAAQAAKIATETIPIVFARSADPIGFGLVATLARPGGKSQRVTGVPMEPRTNIAEFDTANGSYTLYTGTGRGVAGLRDDLARVLGVRCGSSAATWAGISARAISFIPNMRCSHGPRGGSAARSSGSANGARIFSAITRGAISP
jgi:hypothetical protein